MSPCSCSHTHTHTHTRQANSFWLDNTRSLTFTGSPNFGVEDDEIRPQFAGPLALQEGHETAEVLQVEGVVSPGRLVAVADHGAEQTLVARGWRAHKPAQLEGVRDVALDKEQDWWRKDFRQHRSRT